MTLNQRFRLLTLLAGVILVLQLGSTASASPHINGVPVENLYQDYSLQYFLDRSMQFSKDLYVSESYVAGLTKAVVKEIKARRKDGTLRPSDVTNHAWANLPVFTPFNTIQFRDRRISRAYPAWEKSQLEEYFRAMIQVQEIRHQLIASAGPGQKFRMFRREYEQGMKAYANQQWQLAVTWFDGLLESYDYQTVDDVLFYCSEACLELGYLYRAFQGYHDIVENHPRSQFWSDAMTRAMRILNELNLHKQMTALYQNWESEIARCGAEDRDNINYMMARVSFLNGDYDQTIYHVTLMSPGASNRVQGAILLASSKALKGELPQAVPHLQGVLAERHLEEDLRDDAVVKLATIYSKMGEYEEALDLLEDVESGSACYPMALLGRAWAHFHLGDFQKTVEMTQTLLRYFPSNRAAYEAICLEGYSQQTPMATETGEDIFQSVMDDAVYSWTLEDASLERERLFMMLQEAVGLEEDVFMNGRRDLFVDYLQTRSQLIVLLRRLRVLELWEANVKMRPVIEEQGELARVVGELHQLTDPITRGARSATLYDYITIRDDLSFLHDRLGRIQQLLTLSNAPFLQEYETQFANSFSTWLIAKTDEQLGRLDSDLMWIGNLAEQSQEVKAYAARFQLEQDRKKLESAGTRLDLERTELGGVTTEVPVTHLEEWAEFSFRHSFMSGGLLNRYSLTQSRLDDVNTYIKTINQLLSTQNSGSPEATQGEPGVDSPNQ
jgi:tetratricopeptide (TPR) repeat protein